MMRGRNLDNDALAEVLNKLIFEGLSGGYFEGTCSVLGDFHGGID